MATIFKELDSLMIKFRQLWKDRLNVSLSLKSEAWQVSISLSVVLVKEHDEQTFGVNSRERRQHRRRVQNLDIKYKSVAETETMTEKVVGEESVPGDIVAAIATNVTVADAEKVDVDVAYSLFPHVPPKSLERPLLMYRIFTLK